MKLRQGLKKTITFRMITMATIGHLWALKKDLKFTKMVTRHKKVSTFMATIMDVEIIDWAEIQIFRKGLDPPKLT